MWKVLESSFMFHLSQQRNITFAVKKIWKYAHEESLISIENETFHLVIRQLMCQNWRNSTFIWKFVNFHHHLFTQLKLFPLKRGTKRKNVSGEKILWAKSKFYSIMPWLSIELSLFIICFYIYRHNFQWNCHLNHQF